MAPERLKRNIAHLHLLSKANKPQRDALINTANNDLIICLRDCAHNFLSGNIPFTEAEIKKLTRYKNHIRYLGNKKNSYKKQRELIIQEGGFLPLLLTPILTIAGTLLADLITRRNDAYK